MTSGKNVIRHVRVLVKIKKHLGEIINMDLLNIYIYIFILLNTFILSTRRKEENLWEIECKLPLGCYHQNVRIFSK